jgi:curli biogenesis system outer membrane secretion channel CsgG
MTYHKKGPCVRHPSFTLLMVTASILLSGIFFVSEIPYATAGDKTIEDRLANILFEESAQGKIRVAILDFSVSSADTERKFSEKELKDRGSQYAEDLTVVLVNKINNAGKRDKISILDRGRLDEILREKNLPITAISERTATEIGRIAGVDVIIAGRLMVSGNDVAATVKMVRVQDGEILDIVKQDKREKASQVVHTPVTILETIEKLEIGSSKVFSLNLPAGGTATVTVDVPRGNRIDINIIPGSELENFKGHKNFNSVADFTATKTKSYKRSAYLDSGNYYLVLRDSSLGFFSVQSSEIKIMVQLEP